MSFYLTFTQPRKRRWDQKSLLQLCPASEMITLLIAKRTGTDSDEWLATGQTLITRIIFLSLQFVNRVNLQEISLQEQEFVAHNADKDKPLCRSTSSSCFFWNFLSFVFLVGEPLSKKCRGNGVWWFTALLDCLITYWKHISMHFTSLFYIEFTFHLLSQNHIRAHGWRFSGLCWGLRPIWWLLISQSNSFLKVCIWKQSENLIFFGLILSYAFHQQHVLRADICYGLRCCCSGLRVCSM